MMICINNRINMTIVYVKLSFSYKLVIAYVVVYHSLVKKDLKQLKLQFSNIDWTPTRQLAVVLRCDKQGCKLSITLYGTFGYRISTHETLMGISKPLILGKLSWLSLG
jgi:vancomycin permeability regulator SanA